MEKVLDFIKQDKLIASAVVVTLFFLSILNTPVFAEIVNSIIPETKYLIFANQAATLFGMVIYLLYSTFKFLTFAVDEPFKWKHQQRSEKIFDFLFTASIVKYVLAISVSTVTSQNFLTVLLDGSVDIIAVLVYLVLIFRVLLYIFKQLENVL